MRSDVWFEEEDELKVQWICTFFFCEIQDSAVVMSF